MSDVSTYYTQHARTGAAHTASNQNGHDAKKTESDFFDLIFAHLKDNDGEENTCKVDTSATLNLQAPTTTNTATSDFLAQLASTIQLDGQIPTTDDVTATDGTETPAAVLNSDGIKKLQTILSNLLQGMPAEQRPVVLNIKPADIKTALQKLNINVNDVDANSQNLIATGLTPEDLSTLSAILAEGDDSQIQAALVGTMKIVPDGDTTQSIFLPQKLIFTKNDGKKIDETEPSDEIAAALNALSVGGTPPITTAPTPPTDAELNEKGTKGFDGLMKLLEDMQAKGAEAQGKLGNIAPDATPDATTAGAAAKHGPVNSTLGSAFAGTLGSLMNSSGLGDAFPDGMDWSQNTSGLANTQITGQAQLTSLVTQAREATQPHAATQMVAATLVRTAQGGESKNMTLRLDPPDLGKIEVQMHFTKDKAIKTHMVFEKPETMLMMQRDSHALERAMQNAGLDNGNNSLSFELAGRDSGFDGNQNNRDGGNTTNNRGNGASGSNADLIESTMTWYVDGDTGMQHYNILA